MNHDFDNILQTMRKTAVWISLGAFFVSVTYTILFNMGQASDKEVWDILGFQFPYAKVLLAATGVLQDSSEILAFLFGFWILSSTGKKPASMIIMAWSAIILSITLVLWSIASTWGSNNAIIDNATAASSFEKQKLAAIQAAIDTNSAAIGDLSANAAAMRDRAEAYGAKYTSKAIATIGDANTMSQQAAAMAAGSMAAVNKLDTIDKDLISSVNSAEAAFTRIADATGMTQETVGTTFLLTRATQLEMIGIITGLFVILLPAPASARRKHDDAAEDSTSTSSTHTIGGKPLPPMPIPSAGFAPATGYGNATVTTNTSTAPMSPSASTYTSQLQSAGVHVPPTDHSTDKAAPAGFVQRAKEAAQRGAEAGIEKAAEFSVRVNADSAVMRNATVGLVSTAADVALQRAKAAQDPRLLSAALIPEFTAVFSAVTTAALPPVQNQIVAKAKLCSTHKSQAILRLMWIFGWLEQGESGTWSLATTNAFAKVSLPLSEDQAATYATKMIAKAQGVKS